MYHKIVNANSLLVVMAGYFVWNISQVQRWHWAAWLLLAVLLLNGSQDRTEKSWSQFLPTGVFLIGTFYFAYRDAPSLWYMIASWELHNVHHIVNWNTAFEHIPFNDGSIFRLYRPEWFTEIMRFVYNTGFTCTLWFAVIRSFSVKDARKMVQYALAGHVLQLPVIVPFYSTVLLQEVWYVLGQPDGLARHFTSEEAAVWTQNCFPSMHTSVSFAILLIALRERGRLYRWVTVAYCAAVIYSTLYLEVHWVLDVIAGMVLGYCTVKLADFLLSKFWPHQSHVSGKPAPAGGSVSVGQ